MSKLDKNIESLECLNNVIKAHPRYSTAYLNQGTVLYSIKRYQEALESFNKALDLDPSNSDLYFNKGFFYKIEFINFRIDLKFGFD